MTRAALLATVALIRGRLDAMTAQLTGDGPGPATLGALPVGASHTPSRDPFEGGMRYAVGGESSRPPEHPIFFRLGSRGARGEGVWTGVSGPAPSECSSAGDDTRPTDPANDTDDGAGRLP
jgi:hypothetical protein